MADQPNVESATLRLPKKLIVLCDGTWQNSDVGWEKDHFWESGHPTVPTNVTRLGRALQPEDNRDGKGHPQIVYYQAGVGSSEWSIGDKLLGGGLAYGLSENVREAYAFLAHNYMLAEDGQHDEIFLIGFSRGAFTARSVGGMIASVGLLKKEAMEHFWAIFEDFENAGNDDYSPKLSNVTIDPSDPSKKFSINVKSDHLGEYLAAYKAELHRLGLTREVKIKAIVAMDTVGSRGIPVAPLFQRLGLPSSLHRYRFYNTEISDAVENAFQALALDERRAAFNAVIWEKHPGNTTNLKQIWFPGAHSNIGGGYEDSSMADLTLAWIMDQLEPFLEFNEEYFIQEVDRTRGKNFKFSESTNRTSLKPVWQWGMGTIFDGLSFPTNMAGSVTRSPSRYPKINFLTSKPEAKPKLLQKTHEYVHASVRVRKALGGAGPGGKQKYDPPALRGWKLQSGQRGDGAETLIWKFSAPGDPADGRIMEEAPVGRFERMVMEKDPEVRERFDKLIPS